MAQRNVSRRPDDLTPGGGAATPQTPVVRSSELRFDYPFVLVGGRYGIGWQRPEEQGGVDFVVLRRNALGTFKIIDRYALTDEGWAEAWRSLARLDPATAERALAALAQRAEADLLNARSLACLSEVIFLGGYVPGAELVAGKPYDVRFLEDRLAVLPCQGLQALAELPYGAMEAIDIGGPGLVKSGGGFIGGGFGAVGAAEGMAAAAILNALTTRTKIKTVVRVQASGAELFLLHPRTEPEPLRIELSRALGAVREAQAQRRESAPRQGHPRSGSLVEELSKLAGMLERGLLTREEFDHLKARLIAQR
jgi:hypothetical protein